MRMSGSCFASAFSASKSSLLGRRDATGNARGGGLRRPRHRPGEPLAGLVDRAVGPGAGVEIPTLFCIIEDLPGQFKQPTESRYTKRFISQRINTSLPTSTL